MKNRILFGTHTNPHHNLAVEELLFDHLEDGFTFYLWQNQNTVVIGKNQNAWKECRINLLEEEGGKLARRSSGGGAVFHDLGNLNFTFLMPRALYDVERQLSVIQKAVATFGIQAKFTGRNDLVEAETGAKFSGNAFRFSNTVAMHHGTVLVSVDMDKLSRYLAPSREKLSAKGVNSVRARVMNIADAAPGITIPKLRDALADAFISVYGPARVLQEQNAVDPEALQTLTARNASWEWNMGQSPLFDIDMEQRFDWGGLELQLSLRQGQIVDVTAYSDAMDEQLIPRIAAALSGCAFRSADMAACIRELGGPQAEDIAVWMLSKGF